MSAITAPFNDERTRLWTSSACAALLAHLAVVALLLLHVDRQQPVLHGTAEALDVELAGPPASLVAPSAAVAPVQQPPPTPPRPQPQVAAVQPVKPLAQLQPIAQQPEPSQPLSGAPEAATSVMPAAAEASTQAVPDLAVSASTLGQPNAPASPEQLWLAQVIARLERYKSYPRSAKKRDQQDTVTLQFTVNPAGQVMSSSVDSRYHYRVLEDEVREMLRLASPLPPLPKQLADSQIVWHVPMDFHLLAHKPPSVAASCAKPADLGAAPTGPEVTLAQLQAYRARLNEYVAAARSEFDCLGGGSEATALAAQLQGHVDRFNAQAQAFEAKAAAQALQAQQARQAAAARLAQAQATAVRGYAACTPPSAPHRPSAATQAYRKELLGYEATVHVYVACIHQVQLAAGSALTGAQRTVLARRAVQLANAAMLPFNQSVAVYNAQLEALQARERALERQRSNFRSATQFSLAEVTAAQAFVNTWDTAAPLPAGDCIRITRSGRSYQAQLCKSRYAKPVLVSNDHMPRGAVVGIGKPPTPMDDPQTTAYLVSDLQVIGTHLILTIDRKSNVASMGEDDWSSIHFDFTVSSDGRRLVGQCWTAQKRWDCQLPRHQY
jgi:protein TonB